ncbi:MAG TPA: nucleoside monophosphate kinase [Candidatus Paceibacterota bacterium]|nr:nucleoside monophosphate kinase [Candidatus Paceibacterota bacterium]
MDFEVIFIAGPQGSGKGTQGKKLADKLGFLFWGMGGTLRAISQEGTPLAEKIAVMEDGTLISDDVIIEVLRERLPYVPREMGIVFDGVPRTAAQAGFLIPFLRGEGRRKMATVFLDLPRGESVKRLLLRARKEARADDTPEGIEKRFRYYDEMMAPTIAYLKKETTFLDIDGRPSVEEIAGNINTALGV